MARPTPEKLALLRKMLKERGVQERVAASSIPRRASEGDARLSNGQARLWFLDQFEPGSSLYNDALALTIRGIELDPELFQRAFTEVVRRHEVLRTTFHPGPDGPLQRVHPLESARPGHELPFRILDLRGQADAQEALDGMLLEDVQAPFEMDRLPLLRALLARLEDDVWVFGLAMHHIISDGVSYAVVYEEIGALYRAYLAERDSPLLDPPIQFADYAEWERAQVDEDRIQEMLPFWKRYLGGDLPAIKWPARAVAPKNRGAYHRFRFPEALYTSLQNFCRDQQLTSNWVLMTAYLAMLHTLGGQEDVRIGTPSSIRKHAELEKLIGFFVQTVLLRVDLSGNPSFRDVLDRTRETALEVSKYEDVPFDRVVQAVRPKRDPNAVPLIQAWIAPMKDLMPVMELPGATTSYQIVDGKIARFDIALILDEARGGVEAFFEYDTDLWDASMVAQLADLYMRILRQGVEHPETTLELFRETHPAPEPPRDKPAKRKGPKALKGLTKRRPRVAREGGDA